MRNTLTSPVCIGAGVLAIPRAVAFWGWVGGMGLLVVFSIIMYIAAHMLTFAIKHNSKRFRTYHQAVLAICSPRDAVALAIIQHTYMTAATVHTCCYTCTHIGVYI